MTSRSFPAPLVRPLRHLSPQTEGYLLGFLGSFPSILIACAISLGLSTIDSSAFSATPLTVGSFGATAVLLYAVPEAPLSQPRNVIGGHFVSALTGAIISQLFALSDRFDSDEFVVDNTLAARGSWPSLTPVSAALSVALATLAMQLTGTVHPPGASLYSSSSTFSNAALTFSRARRWCYCSWVALTRSGTCRQRADPFCAHSDRLVLPHDLAPLDLHPRRRPLGHGHDRLGDGCRQPRPTAIPDFVRPLLSSQLSHFRFVTLRLTLALSPSRAQLVDAEPAPSRPYRTRSSTRRSRTRSLAHPDQARQAPALAADAPRARAVALAERGSRAALARPARRGRRGGACRGRRAGEKGGGALARRGG